MLYCVNNIRSCLIFCLLIFIDFFFQVQLSCESISLLSLLHSLVRFLHLIYSLRLLNSVWDNLCMYKVRGELPWLEMVVYCEKVVNSLCRVWQRLILHRKLVTSKDAIHQWHHLRDITNYPLKKLTVSCFTVTRSFQVCPTLYSVSDCIMSLF